MKSKDLIREMRKRHLTGRRVFLFEDICKMFPNEDRKRVREDLARFASSENPFIIRACRGVYVNAMVHLGDILEEIASVLRKDHYTYLSNESVLSSYGVISQIPMGSITVMTTGREGNIRTAFGNIEFTTTRSSPMEIMASVHAPKAGSLLPRANLRRAVRDFMITQRDRNQLDEAALHEVLSEESEERVYEPAP